ncbi:MAG TPA: hypothetical protein VMW10_04080, partial [Alphaproteobacteria bacterium]|nr:hypothetical protein [Alphaproteobacteria bacterium]
MKLLKINSRLFFSSLVVLALTAPAAFSMEEDEGYKIRVRQVIALGEKFKELAVAGEYQEVLSRMHQIGLPERTLDNLTRGPNLLHSYILNVTYSYVYSCNELARSLCSRDIPQALKYYTDAATNGRKFWNYYKNINEPGLNNCLFDIVDEIIHSQYSLVSLQPIQNQSTISNLRGLIIFDKEIVEKFRITLASENNEDIRRRMGTKQYNYLVHIYSYLPFVNDQKEYIFYQSEIDEIISSLKELKHSLYEKAVDQKKRYGARIEETRKGKSSAPLSKRGKARLAKLVHEREAKVFNTHAELSQDIAPMPSLIIWRLQEIKEMITASDYDYIASNKRKKEEFAQSQKLVSDKILKFEEEVFRYINNGTAYNPTEENLALVYKSGSEVLDLPLCDRLIGNMICFMNSGDFQNALLRLRVYETTVKKLPKTLNMYPAYLKFMLGDPSDWVLITEEQRKKNNKKKAAKRKKNVALVQEDLAQKKREEQEKLAEIRQKSDFEGEKEK